MNRLLYGCFAFVLGASIAWGCYVMPLQKNERYVFTHDAAGATITMKEMESNYEQEVLERKRTLELNGWHVRILPPYYKSFVKWYRLEAKTTPY